MPRVTTTYTRQSKSLRSMAVALYVSFDIVYSVPDAKMYIAWYAINLVPCFATCAYILKFTNPRELKETASTLKFLLFFGQTRNDLCCSASPFRLSWRFQATACARKCEITLFKTKEITC